MRSTGLVHEPLSDRVDIIGDVHGEIDALRALLARLGCDAERCTVERPIVFVGDLVDRGPDSVAVVDLVQRLVEAGVAQAVLGNHEYNILEDDQKEGNGWYLARTPADGWHDEAKRSVPFPSVAATDEQRARIRAFLLTLPVALESKQLRVVHAAWDAAAIEAARRASNVLEFAKESWIDLEKFDLTGAPTYAELRNVNVPVPFHRELADKLAAEQNGQPIKVLTSGFELPIDATQEPKWITGKWRLVERVAWWDQEEDPRDVVFGHYWRARGAAKAVGKPDAFGPAAPNAWLGKAARAYCIDYSVGYRFKERHAGHAGPSQYGLAALRWPERTLAFDDDDARAPTSRAAG